MARSSRALLIAQFASHQQLSYPHSARPRAPPSSVAMSFLPLTRRLASRAPKTSLLRFRMASTSTTNAQLASLKGQNFMSTAQLSTDQLTGLLAKAAEFKATYSDPETKATAPKPLTGEICSSRSAARARASPARWACTCWAARGCSSRPTTSNWA